jgi:D-3-phosphoglycerate dehydrogenase
VKVLVTCPPMLRMMDQLRHHFGAAGVDVHCPNVVQTLSERELIELVPQVDGWIIGDDPATRAVFSTGKRGRLKAAVKWGIGTDNIDLRAAEELGIPITNTPQMFGREVADLAMSYVVGLARDTYFVHERVKACEWPKPTGISLAGRTLAVVGFGDIGRNVAKRAIAADMNVVAYDPVYRPVLSLEGVQPSTWPDRLGECDFVVLACALTKDNRHALNAETFGKCRDGVRVVNVSRGALVDEAALCAALQNGKVHSAALDVFDVEPLPSTSPLRGFGRVIFGSHNASNTSDAVVRASERAIAALFDFLRVDSPTLRAIA